MHDDDDDCGGDDDEWAMVTCRNCDEATDYYEWRRPNQGNRMQCPACLEWTDLDEDPA